MAESEVASATDDHARAIAQLETAVAQFGVCSEGPLCPRRGEAIARLSLARYRGDDFTGSARAGEHAMYVLMAHNNWWRASQVQQALSLTHKRLGSELNAFTALRAAIVLARRSGQQAFEGLVWGQLAEALNPDAGRETGCECLAMAVLHSSVQRDQFLARLISEAEAIPSDISADDYLAVALEKWNSDGGESLLFAATRVSGSDVADYLASTAEVPAQAL